MSNSAGADWFQSRLLAVVVKWWEICSADWCNLLINIVWSFYIGCNKFCHEPCDCQIDAMMASSHMYCGPSRLLAWMSNCSGQCWHHGWAPESRTTWKCLSHEHVSSTFFYTFHMASHDCLRPFRYSSHWIHLPTNLPVLAGLIHPVTISPRRNRHIIIAAEYKNV